MSAEQNFNEKQERSRVFHGLCPEHEQNLLDLLPDKKYFEFAYHHWQNSLTDDPEARWNQWTPWDVWSYPIDDLIRYKKMILDHRKIITDKKVADIGSHLGIGVLFCLNLGSHSCVGIEPFEAKNRLASFICGKAGYDNFQFLTAELKQDSIYESIMDFDTLILGSLLDMIPDHYRLMDNVSKTNIKNIIIEIGEVEELCNSPGASIKWYYHKEDNQHHGPYRPGVSNPIRGTPNLAFLKMLLGEFNYDFIKQDFFHMRTNEKKPRLRSVCLFEKNHSNKIDGI